MSNISIHSVSNVDAAVRASCCLTAVGTTPSPTLGRLLPRRYLPTCRTCRRPSFNHGTRRVDNRDAPENDTNVHALGHPPERADWPSCPGE